MTNNKPVIHPYLDFDGRCEEALDFYRKAVGAEVLMLMRFKDAPEPARAQCGPVGLDKVMHSRVRIGDSDIMASDGRCTGKPNFHGIALSLTAPDPAAAERALKALSDGGSVTIDRKSTR